MILYNIREDSLFEVLISALVPKVVGIRDCKYDASRQRVRMIVEDFNYELSDLSSSINYHEIV